MKDKKINKLLSDAEKNIGSLSEQIASELFESNKSDEQKLEEHKQGRDDLEFGKYHKPKKIEMFSAEEPEQEPDLVESLASTISARLINEIARDVFGDEVETVEDISPDVQDKFVEAVTDQVLETPELVESKDFKLSEERTAELQEARVRSYISASQKMSDKVIQENELLPTKQEIFEVLGDPTDPVTQAQLSQSMSTILIRIQQQLTSLGGGGTGLYEIKNLLDSLDDKRQVILDSLIDGLRDRLDSFEIDTNLEFDSLNTDLVPEGSSGNNLYYRESRIEEFVDSDYVQERVSIPSTLTFKGGTTVDVDSVSDPDNGDVYVNDSDAVANATWIGVAGQLIPESVALAWADSESPGTGGKWYKVGDMKQDNDQIIKDAENKAMPPGSVTMWMGGNSPSGYFFCRGGTFDHTRYPLLHAHLQASYSGYVTGTLPDFRGRFPGGDGGTGMSPLDGKTGRLFNQMTAEPSSTGLSVTADQNMTVNSTASTTVSSTGSSHTHTASSSSSTSGSGRFNTESAGNHRHRFGDAAKVDGSASGGRMYHNPDNGSAQTGYAGDHVHEVDISNASFTTSTSTTVKSTNSEHAHSASTTVNTTLGDKDITVDVDGWDDYTRPYAFNVNFIIKHDAE